MNILTTEYDRQTSTYQQIRNRLLNPPKREAAPPAREPAYVRYMAPQIPLWARETINFNAHIVDFRAWQHEQYERQTAKGHILRRCEDFGVSYTILVGPSRRRSICNLRQVLYFEVHEKFGRSFPQIGRLFGGRDHTTALHGYRKVKAMTADEREGFIVQAVKDLAA